MNEQDELNRDSVEAEPLELFLHPLVFCVTPPYPMPVCPLDSRSKDIVEPLLKPQWYVSCAEMGKDAADAVRNGQLKIIPDHHLKTWFNWLDNIR